MYICICMYIPQSFSRFSQQKDFQLLAAEKQLAKYQFSLMPTGWLKEESMRTSKPQTSLGLIQFNFGKIPCPTMLTGVVLRGP